MNKTHQVQVAVIGGGFTGLSAAYELMKSGVNVAVIEAEDELGGLAAAFDVQGEKLDRFYHHWFTNDREVMDLIEEIGLSDRVSINPTNTGMFYANQFFKLSTPMDLLKFSPLKFIDRIRLGLLALRARRVKNWMELEDKTAAQWLRELGGESVYRVVWEPLLKGKFGAEAAEQVSAVWFWNKLKLRGGSRGKGGEERLAYLKGGFVGITNTLSAKITSAGGKVILGSAVNQLYRKDGLWHVHTANGTIVAEHVIATPALPLIADMISEWATEDYLKQLRRIQYLGNVCLVLELNHSLSDTYWLNVNDPTFPFVGVIEHTNFENAKTYGGRHIVYLSKYLPVTEPLYSMTTDEVLEYAMPHLKRMFPKFEESWILEYKVWRSRWSQPIVEKRYSQMIPSAVGPEQGLHIASMAQIYPEDRGTNYAIREGRKIGRHVAAFYSGNGV